MEKPQVKHVTFKRNEGSYNWLNTKEESAQYSFTLPHLSYEEIKEMKLINNFLVDLEKDYSFTPDSYTPLEAAYEIKSICDPYWIHTGKADIQRLIDYLEEIEDEQEQLRHKHEIENAKYQIHYWEQELERLNYIKNN